MGSKIRAAAISGLPEWLPNVRLVEERVLDAIRKQFQLYGFAPIETAAIERMEVLTAKGGMQRQIYAVGRPEEGGQEETDLGLHFDLTVPLARYVAQHNQALVFPFRRYQIQKVWRGERPQRGRFREFYQCDVDVVGRGRLNSIHDAEMPCVINATLDAIGVPKFCVHVSNRKILAELLAAQGCAPGELLGALRAIDKSGRDGIERTRDALGEEGVPQQVVPPLLDLIQCERIDQARHVFAAAKAQQTGFDELQVVIDRAKDLGMPHDRIRPSFSIARGLDYYTGTVYETFVIGKEEWGSVCSGGRYDDLASYFTTQTFPGVGVSVGLTRLFDLLIKGEYLEAKIQTPTEVLVTMQDRERYMPDYLGLTRTLRDAGLRTEVYLDPDPLREQIAYAASKCIPFAVIAGGREFDDDLVVVRDLRHSAQETMHGDEMTRFIRQKLADS